MLRCRKRAPALLGSSVTLTLILAAGTAAAQAWVPPPGEGSFALPEAGWVTLDVFDVSGRRVATPVDAGYGAGWHRVAWTADDAQGGTLVPGIYFYKLTAGGATTEAQRLLIIR